MEKIMQEAGEAICTEETRHEETVRQAQTHALSEEELLRACKIFQILSEPSRFKIVYALLSGALCVYHITEACGGTVSGVSHQLRVLRDNGIVKARRFGKNVEYALSDEHVRELVEMGVAHAHCND